MRNADVLDKLKRSRLSTCYILPENFLSLVHSDLLGRSTYKAVWAHHWDFHSG